MSGTIFPHAPGLYAALVVLWVFTVAVVVPRYLRREVVLVVDEPSLSPAFQWPLAEDLAVAREVRRRYDGLPYRGWRP